MLIYVNVNALLLYGCEYWSVTAMEKHVLRVWENRMLRR
jgi:hypothetical protein